ncbi:MULTISPECIES: AAA family ATPase [Marinobacter]|uniref:AAA family ATPase n=1 Tax=Marinobacter TaxID=2742 RepID=UPI00124727E4|nr:MULTISPECIES: AAA family ATPase [Marinobacter]MBL3559115.1 AAA family ATPase [Marinobacter sp. JB05H06]
MSRKKGKKGRSPFQNKFGPQPNHMTTKTGPDNSRTKLSGDVGAASAEQKLVAENKEKLMEEVGVASEAELNKLREELKTLQAELHEREQVIQEKSETVAASDSRVNEHREALARREAELLRLERDLQEREINAANGFLVQNRESLKQLNDACQDLEEQKANLFVDLQKMQLESREKIAEECQSLNRSMEARAQELDERDATIIAREEALAEQQDRRKLELKSAKRLREVLRSELENEFQAELESIQSKLTREHEKGQTMALKMDELQRELDEFAHLQDVLAGKSPEALLEERDELKKRLRVEMRRVQELEELNEENDTDALTEECERLQDENKTLRQKLEELKARDHSVKMGVLERERWTQEKRLLQEEKKLIGAQVKDLESRLGSLTDSQSAEEAFPELCRMDREHSYQTKAAVEPVTDLEQFTQELKHRIAALNPDNPLYFRDEDLQLFVGGLAMSQLHVFQGISGTGKTSLAKAFAKAVGGECQDIAVQAGWRDRSDLLGHYNAFEKRFYEKDCLQALYRAAMPNAQDRLNIVLLDEMNLSRPEQYFADFLSALEKEPGDRWIPLMESAPKNAPQGLRLGREIEVPENLWFIGTANQDETTSELADKTHDRAFVLELPRHEGKFSINHSYGNATFSFTSLKSAFKWSQKSEAENVKGLLELVAASRLTNVLEDRFGLGWGNRFERQALRFLPVVKMAGGTFEQGLDHLLSTRLFRPGKITGRYDVDFEDLDQVEVALTELFESIGDKSAPSRCMNALEWDRRRLERGV